VTVSGIISAIIIGLIIGSLGRLAIPGKQSFPIWLTLLIGLAAAFLGTAVASAIGVADTRGIDWIELVLQVGFAAAGVVAVSRLRSRRRQVTHSGTGPRALR